MFYLNKNHKKGLNDYSIMKKFSFLALIASLFLAMAFSGCIEQAKPGEPVQQPPEEPQQPPVDPLFACSTDADCIKAEADCCGCNQGGSKTAINKNFESEWKQQLNCSEGTICIQVISNDPSCFDEQTQAKCVQGACKIV